MDWNTFKEAIQSRGRRSLLDAIKLLAAAQATAEETRSLALPDLGLDSLMAIQLRNPMCADLRVDVPVGESFESPDFEHLADRLVEEVTPANLESSLAGAIEGRLHEEGVV